MHAAPSRPRAAPRAATHAGPQGAPGRGAGPAGAASPGRPPGARAWRAARRPSPPRACPGRPPAAGPRRPAAAHSRSLQTASNMSQPARPRTAHAPPNPPHGVHPPLARTSAARWPQPLCMSCYRQASSGPHYACEVCCMHGARVSSPCASSAHAGCHSLQPVPRITLLLSLVLSCLRQGWHSHSISATSPWDTASGCRAGPPPRPRPRCSPPSRRPRRRRRPRPHPRPRPLLLPPLLLRPPPRRRPSPRRCRCPGRRRPGRRCRRCPRAPAPGTRPGAARARHRAARLPPHLMRRIVPV